MTYRACATDLEVRIPVCCGKERLVGPRPATEYLSENPSHLVAFPPKDLRLLPSLKPNSCLEPAEVFVCGACDKVYAAPVLEAFQKRVYEIEDKAGVVENSTWALTAGKVVASLEVRLVRPLLMGA
ncbi:unnamed protein product [Dibothriocephalus latus]|uniref:Uncharacterized protein n=1 Tax=Dibothriocephalus latus TaxID=60516 RepID=A0A3P7M0G3_DIBLA|nr:unnamed protein product [Dibothriocephalus latus]